MSGEALICDIQGEFWASQGLEMEEKLAIVKWIVIPFHFWFMEQEI